MKKRRSWRGEKEEREEERVAGESLGESRRRESQNFAMYSILIAAQTTGDASM
jgi:hypothetical protein